MDYRLTDQGRKSWSLIEPAFFKLPDTFQTVNEFAHLGTVISNSGSHEADIKRSVGMAKIEVGKTHRKWNNNQDKTCISQSSINKDKNF